MRKILFIMVAILMVMGVDGFKNVTFPGSPLSCEEAEAQFLGNNDTVYVEIREVRGVNDVIKL